MKIINTVLYIAFLTASLKAQPEIQWQKTFGGTMDDKARAIAITTDGGYIIAGYSTSFDGDLTDFHGGADFWVIKLNPTGDVAWQRTYGGSEGDYPKSIQQTSDGGYIVAGFTYSYDGDIAYNQGGSDYWMLKLNQSGDIEWQKTYGGSQDDLAYSVQQTSEGGYVVAGYSNSDDGDVFGNHSLNTSDYWVVKTDASGEVEWQKTLGGTQADFAYAMQQTNDGGYIVLGESSSNDGDVSGAHGNSDLWVVKLDEFGEIEWQKALGGSLYESAWSIRQSSDGGYILSATTGSNNGDVSGKHGNYDCWVVKLDGMGALIWQKCFGGFRDEDACSIQETADGGYIMAGHTASNDGNVSGNHSINTGYHDIWLVKISASGELQWQKPFGGSLQDETRMVLQTSDYGYIIAGFSNSNDGDLSATHGDYDFWIAKLGPTTVGLDDLSATAPSAFLEVFPNPATDQCYLQVAGDATTLKVGVYNLMGQAISLQTIPNGGRLILESFPEGLLTLTASTESGKLFSGKLFKQH